MLFVKVTWSNFRQIMVKPHEWHTDDIGVHTSDIPMAHEYIRVTYGWHTSAYSWHTDYIRVDTSGIWIAYEYIRVTYGRHTSAYEWHTIICEHIQDEWHTDDIGVHMTDIPMAYMHI